MKKFNFNISKARIRRHMPLILTIISSLGVVGTAVCASHDTLKASEKAKTKDKVLSYIPTTVVSLATVAAIIGNHRFTEAQMTALVSALATSTKLTSDLKEAIRNNCTEEEQKKIHAEIARKYEEGVQLASHPTATDEFKTPDTLFYDEWSGNWFYANMVAMKDSIIAMNKLLTYRSCACYKEWFDILGIVDPIVEEWGCSDLTEWGWGDSQRSDGYPAMFDVSLLEFNDSGREYYVVVHNIDPSYLDSSELKLIDNLPWQKIIDDDHAITAINVIDSQGNTIINTQKANL